MLGEKKNINSICDLFGFFSLALVNTFLDWVEVIELGGVCSLSFFHFSFSISQSQDGMEPNVHISSLGSDRSTYLVGIP